MGLIFRTTSTPNAGVTQIKGAALTFEEGDGNFAWLATNLSGSVVNIQGTTTLAGDVKLPSLTTTAQNSVVTINTATGQLYYTASTAFGGVTISTSSLLITASATANVLTFTKGDSSTFTVTVDTGSIIPADTGSFLKTGSVADNILTFIKGDSSTFNLTVNTGSFLKTGSVVGNVLTYTKGDNSNFSLTVITGSTVVTASATTLYSIGIQAGTGSFSSNGSVLLGYRAGGSTDAATITIGSDAGYEATSSSGSIMIGYEAGRRQAQANYNILIGYQAGYTIVDGPIIGDNNIVIGNLRTVATGARNAVNIGGFIFATGSETLTLGAPSSSPIAEGKVGIGQNNPQYTLDVSGSVGIDTILRLREQDPLPAGGAGQLATSGSNLYFYSGSSWCQVQLV